jgi:hypothetical protein
MLILIDTSLSAYWIGMVRTGASGTMPVSAREKNSSKNVKEVFEFTSGSEIQNHVPR